MLFEEDGPIIEKPFALPCVYFLLQIDPIIPEERFVFEVVYVGITGNLAKRIATHHREGLKSFDYYSFIKPRHDDPRTLREIEDEMILKYRPKYNVKYPDGSLVRNPEVFC